MDTLEMISRTLKMLNQPKDMKLKIFEAGWFPINGAVCI